MQSQPAPIRMEKPPLGHILSAQSSQKTKRPSPVIAPGESYLDKLARFKNLKNHPLYLRWNSIITRTGRKDREGKPDQICDAWKSPAQAGFPNFLKWVVSELRKHDEAIYRGKFTIKRKNESRPWSPENCYIVPRLYTPERILAKQTPKKKKPASPSTEMKGTTMASIDFMITPVRITQKDLQDNPGKAIELCEFAGKAPRVDLKSALSEIKHFVEKKTDEVYLLQDEEGVALLMMFFCRYPHLRAIHITSIFTSLGGTKELEAIKLAIGLLDDEMDYVNYAELLMDEKIVAPAMDAISFAGLLKEEGFVPKVIGKKTFLSKE